MNVKLSTTGDTEDRRLDLLVRAHSCPVSPVSSVVERLFG